jgi:alcohol dehydrogenase YqhD (iron-dependent ADH family)
MPAWMEYMYARRPKRYYRFAKNVMQIDVNGKSEEQVIKEGIEAFRIFLSSIGVPMTLRSANIAESDLPSIVEGVVKVSFGQDGMLKCIPPVSRTDIMDVLKLAY